MPMNALVEVGFEVSWKSGSEDEFLDVQMVNGFPMLEDDRCQKLIEEIEAFRKAKVKAMRAEKQGEEKGFRIGSIWEQLKKLLIWLMKNDIAKGVDLLKSCIVRRRNEILEDERRIMEQKDLMLAQIQGRETLKEKTILIEVCCNEDSKMSCHIERGEEVLSGSVCRSMT